jgi:hypothetical protein
MATSLNPRHVAKVKLKSYIEFTLNKLAIFFYLIFNNDKINPTTSSTCLGDEVPYSVLLAQFESRGVPDRLQIA